LKVLMSASRGLWSFVILSLLLCGRGAFSQGTNATLNGTVLDSAGAAVPGAHVTVVNTGTNATQAADSNDQGVYSIGQLAPGSYTVTIERTGFRKTVQTGVVLTVNQVATLNVSLEIGDVQQTVSVSADAALINATTAEVSTVVDQHAISQLPLNGRDPSSLVFLAPGVTNVLNTGGGYLQTGFSFPTETGASANGGRQGSTYYLLDGVQNMDTYLLLAAPFPNSDAVQEFRVISNNFDAHYGFSPGAVVSIQTKSGSNQWHGGAFEFIRNSDLNAGNYFTHAVDSLRRNQFGGYVGGPIIKNKLFFFANYQGTRSSSEGATNPTSTPTAAMLNGDFSAVPVALKGPFVNNMVDPSLFSPAAVAIAKTALPLGGNPASGLTNYASGAVVNAFNEGTFRLDWELTSKQHIVFRTYINSFDQPAGSVNGNILSVLQETPYNAIQNNPMKYFNQILSHTWVISPSLVNVVSAFWTQESAHSSAQVFDQSGQAVCLSRYIQVTELPGQCYIEGLSVNNGFSTAYTEPSQEVRTSFGVSDALSKTIGNHSLSFGADIWHQYAKEYTQYPTQPIINFNGSYTGFGLADFLLGEAAQFTQGAGEIADVSGIVLGLFAQDQYRVRPTVTLTAGVRWDPNLPPTSAGGRGAAFIPGQQSVKFPGAPLGLNFPGDKGVDSSLMPTSYGYIEPRLGVAWQPRSLPNTAFRAGFGLFTAPLPYSVYNHAADIAPFSPTYGFDGTATNFIPFDNPYSFQGITSPFPPFASIGFVPPSDTNFGTTPIAVQAIFSNNFRLGITQSWNASVEQQFGRDFALHLAYVGSESYHQETVVDQNPGIDSIRQLSKFTNILTMASIGTASYNSLQAGFEKRFSHGLQFQSNFTWAKTIDLAGSGNVSFGTPQLPNPFDIRFNRGTSLLNFPYVSVSHLVYTTPELQGHGTLMRELLGSWELSGIVTLQSGQPFGIAGGNGNNNSGSLQFGDRADVVPGIPLNVHQGSKAQWLAHYLNPAAFVTNAPGTFGNSGKNLLRGPGINSSDLAFVKNWKVRESYGVQFRWEMFNAFNHASFATPNNDPTSANFGQITSVGPIAPRVMQGALKLSF
jgi:hypothetical protein